MLKFISAEEIHNARSVIIDVRSESEFAEANIPGSVSLPILNDDERAEIGTLYKNAGPHLARKRGVEIVRPKLAQFFTRFKVLSGTSAPSNLSTPSAEALNQAFDKIIGELWEGKSSPAPARIDLSQPVLTFYCWRGGDRSQSMARLAECLGFSAQVIKGGHKAFRAEVQNFLNSPQYPFKLCVLYGLTGVGKTKMLKKWLAEGKPVIDLENLAKHRGSAFGQIGINELGRQKDFENRLYWNMQTLTKRGEKVVVIEGESKRIGRCQLSDAFMLAMEKGIRIRVNCSLEERVQNILTDYVDSVESGVFDREALSSLFVIKKRLGGELHKKIESMLLAKDYAGFVRELLVNYYDKWYVFSREPASFYQGTVGSGVGWDSLAEVFS